MSHEFESSNPIRELTLDMVEHERLTQGDVIVGLQDSVEINELEAVISDKMIGKRYSRTDWQILSPPSKGPSGLLADAMRPKKFNGRLMNATALVVDSGYPHYSDRPYYLRLLVSADMHSSGRGIVSRTSSEVVYQEGHVDAQFHMHNQQGYQKALQRIFVGRDLDSTAVEAVVQGLNWESGSTAQIAAALALQHTVLAGLPTLGKR